MPLQRCAGLFVKSFPFVDKLVLLPPLLKRTYSCNNIVIQSRFGQATCYELCRGNQPQKLHLLSIIQQLYLSRKWKSNHCPVTLKIHQTIEPSCLYVTSPAFLWSLTMPLHVTSDVSVGQPRYVFYLDNTFNLQTLWLSEWPRHEAILSSDIHVKCRLSCIDERRTRICKHVEQWEAFFRFF